METTRLGLACQIAHPSNTLHPERLISYTIEPYVIPSEKWPLFESFATGSTQKQIERVTSVICSFRTHASFMGRLDDVF